MELINKSNGSFTGAAPCLLVRVIAARGLFLSVSNAQAAVVTFQESVTNGCHEFRDPFNSESASDSSRGTDQFNCSISECVVASCTPAEAQTILPSIDAMPLPDDTVDCDIAIITAGMIIDSLDEKVANAQLKFSGDSAWRDLFPVKTP